MISATSLITAVLGFFAKDFVDTDTTGLTSGHHAFAEDLLLASLALLVVTAIVIVFGVLRPAHRYLFGSNWLTNGFQPEAIANGAAANANSIPETGPPIGDLTTGQIDWIAFNEYGQIYCALAKRSMRKAYWLTVGYFTFMGGVALSALAASYIIYETTVYVSPK